MKPPAGWPRITPSVYYEEPNIAIDWLCAAFGFEVRLKIEGENGRIEHSELTFGDDGMIMVGTAAKAGATAENAWQATYASPRSLDGRGTQAVAIFVDDVDDHHDRAAAAGARIVRPLETNDYGDDYWSDRSYGCCDPEGHLWWFMQRMRDQKPSGK